MMLEQHAQTLALGQDLAQVNFFASHIALLNEPKISLCHFSTRKMYYYSLHVYNDITIPKVFNTEKPRISSYFDEMGRIRKKEVPVISCVWI